MFVGVVLVLQAALRPSRYATRFSSIMFVVSGVILFASGIALALARELATCETT